MIALTCAVTSQPIYFNPELILVLESNSIGRNNLPVCRVHVGPGQDNYFVVSETASAIHDKIEDHFAFRSKVNYVSRYK